RMRAVEEGLPLVRVATTGISGVYDSLGRVRAQLGLGWAGIVDSGLPVAGPATPYSRFGNFMVAVMAVLLVVLSPVFREKPAASEKSS
ncbi:MAG: apolipoprotein N-acyltransferase, partial [Rhodospirillales bacterium]|nr:apolipoprotein N-acyltransferase [Rhodospirillales bacterium]